jgi:hypothetical protein
MKEILMRLPDELADAVTQRAERVELSRNAWLVKALEWALDQPVRVRTVRVEEKT